MSDIIEIGQLKQLLAELIQSQKETDEKFKETDKKFKETDEQFKETNKQFKETNKQFKETDAKIKRLSDLFEGQWGKLMESLVEGDLVNLLRARGIAIRDTYTRRKGRVGQEHYELDIVAHNGDEIVVVEVKTTLRVKHVDKFLRQLKHLKEWLPEYKKYKIYGAIAFLRAEENSEIYAERKKLFVIRATGNSSAIINEQDFKPKAF